MMALVIAAVMVLGMATSAMADGGTPAATNGGDYKITVTNTNENVSIKNKTYYAYKLFEARYVKEDQAVSGDDGYTDTSAETTPYSQDDTPHAYYIKKGSPFFVGAKQLEDYIPEGESTANGRKKYVPTDSTGTDPFNYLAEYFYFVEIPGQEGVAEADQLVLVQPKSSYDASKAYELSQKLAPTLDVIDAMSDATEKAKWTTSANTGANESVEITVNDLGAGYYLVRGDATAYKEGDTAGTATGKTVAAAIALTTTDPEAEIIAKVDATKVNKEILEDSNGDGTPETEVKYNNTSVGSTVPYVVTAEVPNLTGYEKYFFIMNDTLSQGLTLNDNGTNDGYNDGFVVQFVHKTDANATKLVLTRNDTATASTATTQPTHEFMVEKGTDNSFKVILKNFIQYKGDLITEAMFDATTGQLIESTAPTKYDGTKFTATEITKDMIGTYTNPFVDYEIQIIYSATVNEDAKIGSTGNPNTATLQYSNKPDVKNDGEPGNVDKPNETDENSKVTEITPETKTITYVTGLKLLKYTVRDGQTDKLPLAGAKFTFVGDNLKNIVTQATEYYEAVTSGGDVYKLSGDRYTSDAPTLDTVTGYTYDTATKTYTIPSGVTDSSTLKITYGTIREYDGYTALTPATVKTLHGDVTVYTADTGARPQDITPGYKKTTLTETAYEFFKEDTSANPAYYELTNGSFTDVAPTATTASNYVGGTSSPKHAKVTVPTNAWETMPAAEKAQYKTDGTNHVQQTVETDASGIILLRGLGAGHYTLTEVEAPDGYNLLAQPIEFKIEWEKDESGAQLAGATPLDPNATTVNETTDKCKWKISYRNLGDTTGTWTEITQKDEDNVFTELLQMDVLNNTGTELPSTGGIGTTLFYLGGAILVLAGGILLVSKRRMA